MYRGAAAALLTVLLSGPVSAAQEMLPGSRDTTGYRVPPVMLYCMPVTGRPYACGGPEAPLTINVQPSAGVDGGLSTFRVSNPPGVPPMRIKESAGRLYSFYLCNTGSSARYVRFYDALTATVGQTQIAIGPIMVSAGSCQQFATNYGLTFKTGMVVSITAAPADNDATPGGVGEITGFLGFQ